MKVQWFGAVVAGAMLFAVSGQAAAVRSHINTGVEYHFATGDADNAAGIYANYEIELPDPVSAVIGVSYFGGDYQLSYVDGDHQPRELSGSYTSVGLEALLLIAWDKGIWRPYVATGGAQYFNSFDNDEFPDKLGMIIEGGTQVQLGESITAHLSLRHMSLRPDHLDARIGELEMDAVVVRAGFSFNF